MAWAIAVAALFALITGAICLRTKGVHFIMITMAFGQMVYFAIVSIETYGGDDGLVIDTRSEFPGLDLSNPIALYAFVFYFLFWWCCISSTGLVNLTLWNGYPGGRKVMRNG